MHSGAGIQVIGMDDRELKGTPVADLEFDEGSKGS